MRTSKQILVEKPELGMPKIVLQGFGMLCILLGGIRLFFGGEINSWEGWVLLGMLILGGSLVIPQITMAILDKAHDILPWGKKSDNSSV